MTYGSLFSGIGGIDLGLDRAGMECKWQVEIDPFCRKVLAKHWPDVRRYEDVRTVGADNLEPVDLIAGGFPCQDVSQQGQRAGIREGTRSGLWFEYHRIVCELRPRFILVENVTGLLTDGMGRVLSDLAESGYDAEWTVLSASMFGAPHHRERVFLVAYPSSIGLHEDWTLLADVQAKERQKIRRVIAGATVMVGGPWITEPPPIRMADGLSSGLDRLKSLGNAVVPQCAEYIGQLIMERDRLQMVEEPI